MAQEQIVNAWRVLWDDSMERLFIIKLSDAIIPQEYLLKWLEPQRSSMRISATYKWSNPRRASRRIYEARRKGIWSLY